MKLRIAAFGFRSLPPTVGSAGADKFAQELFPRLVRLGHEVTAYNRIYPGQKTGADNYMGVKLKYFNTINTRGFDTLLHSFKCTLDIILTNSGKIVHIQNGGNSIWAIFLRLFGKKVFISQDGLDWNRAKWPWYGKLYLKLSTYITSRFPNRVIFDNIFAKEYFEKKFKQKYDFIPFGSEVPEVSEANSTLTRLNVRKKEYYLFIGRFIPDKGLHYLIPAFEKLNTDKKLVLVGGSPNPSLYEKKILSTTDKRIIFPGYIYGEDSIVLIKNAYCYIQPSDVEGLSPVILTAMGLGTPLICSDIPENLYIVEDMAVTFKKSNVDSLLAKLNFSLTNYTVMEELSKKGKQKVLKKYNWDTIAKNHIDLFVEELR